MALGAAYRTEPIAGQWQLPIKGVLQGINDIQIPQDALYDASNVDLELGSLQGRRGLTPYTSQLLNSRPLGALNFWNSTTAGYVLVATALKVWALNIAAVTWTELDGPLSATEDDATVIEQFSFGTPLTNHAYIANGKDPLKTWKVGDPGITSVLNFGFEQVTDGGFSTDVFWTFGSGWVFDGSNFEADYGVGNVDNKIQQDVLAVVGETYKVVFTVLNYISGSITPAVGGASGTSVSGDGTYSQEITATTTGNLIFTPSTDFSGALDDVSVQRITGSEKVTNGSFASATGWTFGANWAFDGVNFEADHTSGATAVLEQDVGAEAGKSYTVVFTMKNRTAGTITPKIGTIIGSPVNSNGVDSQEIAAAGIGNLQFIPSSSFDGSIDDVSVSVLGEEKVKNGLFDSAADWTFNAGWSFDATQFKAKHTAGSTNTLEQDIDSIATDVYNVIYKVSNRTAGDITVEVGGTMGTTRSSNKTWTEVITAINTNNLIFIPSSDFNGRIDAVSVKRISGSEKVTDGDFATDSIWVLGTDWSIGSGIATFTPTVTVPAALEQDVLAQPNTEYQVVFTLKNWTAGNVTPQLGGVAGTSIDSNITSTQFITTIDTTNLKFIPSADFSGSIDDVSVKTFGAAPIFRDLAIAGDRILGLVDDHMVQWGEPLDDTTWPVLNARVLGETAPPCTAIKTMGVVGVVVYKKDSIWLGELTGQPGGSSFRFSIFDFVEGPAGPKAVVDAAGKHVYMTKQGRIGVFTGFSHKWVADGVWTLIKAEIDQSKPNRIWGVYIPQLEAVRFHYQRTGQSITDGLVIVRLQNPNTGRPYAAFPGRMSKSITAGCTVWDDSFTVGALVFGSTPGAEKPYQLSGLTDDGSTVNSFIQTGMIVPNQAMGIDRVLPIEPFVERLAGYGTATVKAVTSNILDVIGGTLSAGSPLDLTTTPIKSIVGVEARGRFIGVRYEWTSASTFKYRGTLLRAGETNA